MRYRLLSASALAILCSCSTGGTSSPTLAPVNATGAPVSPSTSASIATPNASARFTITVPNSPSTTTSSARHRQYISSATKSVIITLESVDGTPYTGTPSSIASNLTTSNPACSGSPLMCSVIAPAVAGSDVFLVSTYDAQQASTNPGSPTGNLLSQATLTIGVTAGIANVDNTPLILSGVASSVDVGLSPSSVTKGTSTSVTVSVNVRDTDNNIIMGSYIDASGDPLSIDLADSDTTGATTLSPASVTTSSTAVSLAYNGGNIASPSITPSVTGGSISGALTPATLAVGVPGPVSLSATSLTFNGTSQTQSVTITDSGYSGSFTVTGCTGPTVVSTSTSGTTFSVTSAMAGTCTLTVADPYTSATLPITVTTLTIPVE